MALAFSEATSVRSHIGTGPILQGRSTSISWVTHPAPDDGSTMEV